MSAACCYGDVFCRTRQREAGCVVASAFIVQLLAIACMFVPMDRSEIVNLWKFRKIAKGIGNQSKWPQYGQGASPAGMEGSMATSFPQTGQRFGRPPEVRDEGSMLELYIRDRTDARLTDLVQVRACSTHPTAVSAFPNLTIFRGSISDFLGKVATHRCTLSLHFSVLGLEPVVGNLYPVISSAGVAQW